MSPPASPAWLQKAVFYQIYPQSFADSNGDGIGDIPGIIAKLAYLRNLGVNALWLNPIYPSPFGDAGYDISDFYGVAPRYGTLADARKLFAEAHARGMRVVLDLVAGHTSVEHPWFRASMSGERTPYHDWYVWTDSVWDGFREPGMINGLGRRDGAYLPNFFHFQPALNYGYARPAAFRPWQQPVSAPGPRAVRRELRKIMTHWLGLGCDGFRVDMASSLVKGDKDGAAQQALWGGFRRWLERDWPEAILVSEWSSPRAAIGAGFHIDFLIHFNAPAYNELCAPRLDPARADPRRRGYFDADNRGNVGAFLRSYLDEYRATRGRGYIALPTGNHDFARFRHGRSERELRVFLALVLTLPGVPFIYYGDEIGLDYRPGLPSVEGGYGRTGTRTPMQWDSGPNRGFSTAPADRIYLPVDNVPGRDVAAQSGDTGSLLALVKVLLGLRRTHAALGNDATFRPVHARTGHPAFVFSRGVGRSRVIVAVNPTRRPGSVALPGCGGFAPLFAEGAVARRGRLMLAPFSFGVWLVHPSQGVASPKT